MASNDTDPKAVITENVGKWLSAALDDPQVCKEMKDDIIKWMEAGKPNIQPGQEWRCFYCGELFTSKELAAEHFGDYEGCECDTPACRLTAEEGPLITYIRRLRAELAGYYQEEDAISRSVEIMKSDHRQALVVAEQRGYDKGVQDMKAQGLCPEPSLHNPNVSPRNNAILRLREWHKFQSSANTNGLYNAASVLFNSKFDPTEYDDVE